MNTRRAVLAVSLALILVGCATPRIQLNAGGMAMEVNSKVPGVGAVDYAPDGKSVISGGWDDVVRLWDLTGAREMMKLKDNKGYIDGLAFSPDGKTIAVAGTGMTNFSDNTITLWDAATGKVIRELAGSGGHISFSSDGRYILGNPDGFKAGTVKVHDARTGALVRELRGNSGCISPDGKYAATADEKGVVLRDIAGGADTWVAPIGNVRSVAFSPDGKYVLAARNPHGNENTTSLVLLDAAYGREMRVIGLSAVPGGTFSAERVYGRLGAAAFSPDGKIAMSGDLRGRYKIWDVSNGALLRPLKTVDETEGTLLNVVPSIAFSPDGRTVVVSSLAATRLYDVATGDELATLVGFEDGEWLVITSNGYYNSSEKGDQYLSVAVGGKPYTIAQLRESFFRPDLVKVALSGGSLKSFRTIADIKQPPAVAIVDTPSSVGSDSATVKVRVADQGGGIGDVRLYLNGSAVILDNGRGVKIVPREGNAVERTYTVKLLNGLNTIRAIAFNGDNSMQSADATQEITASYRSVRKPSLYALVVGINDFKNPKLQLKYSIPDADLFAATLRRAADGLFDNMVIKKLTAAEETTSENIRKELASYRSLNPDDLFVFYVASHGTVDDGEYFLITSNVGSTRTEKLRTDAITQTAFKELIANIPATKKLIVIDTCDAGALGDAVQAAMLTRGMSEDTAMKVLSRAVGSTILSAATSNQEALEGYEGHGLFTYVVSDGLSGKADTGKSGFIKTTELADYVDSEVPALAERVFKRAQYPTISISGMGFPIGRTTR